MAGNWWGADKIEGPASAGNWWDADAVVKDDAPSAATAGPDAKGDGFFSMERAKGVLSSLANAVPFVGADDGKPNPFAEYVKGAAERARGNLPVLEDGTLKPAEPKKFKSVLETQAWPDTVPSDDELRRLSRRDYAKAQEDEARRIRTGGHEMRATKPAPVLSAAEAGAKRFAEDNPVTASIKSSAAQSLAGLANAPSAAAQAGNEMVRNAMIGFGADVPASRVPNMPLVDDLMKMSGAYTSELQRRAPGEAWDRGEFGQWLLTQLGGNSMNTIQSLGALMVPGMQGALLTSMGATAAGTSYATGDSGIASIGKGVVEAVSEKLPLEAAGFATKKVSSLIEKIPAASRNAILQDAGRRLVAAGGAVTFNSLVGAIEESAAQIGGNAIDIAIDGKTKSLFDEVDRAAIVGAAANTSMAAPAIIEAARRPTTDAGRLAGELADALNGGQFAQAGIDQTVSDMLRTVGTSDNIAPTSTSMAAAAGERARLEQMRAPRPTVADIGKAASVDEAIATAEQSVAPDVPPSVQPAQAAQVPAGTGRAVQLDEADLLKRAMAGIDMPQEAAQPALAQAAPVVEQQAAPEAATPAAQDQPVRTWFGRRGDGYATPEDAQRGLSERQRLQKDLQWRIEQTPEGRYRLAGYAAPVGGTQALQTPQPQVGPVAAKPLPAARTASQGQDIILQNRDRNTPASIYQMQSIAANPDYLRAGPSRTMDQGAPVAFGAMPPSAVQGRVETVADGRGQRIQTQYAVVEAADLLASNQADGTPVPEYATGEPGRLRVVAGNGRTAGLQAAYLRGTAAQYREELQQDAQSLGIDPQAVAAMREPVLIRVMDEADVTPDIADRSNIQAGSEMSAVERANNDARRIHVSDMEFHDNGTPTEASLLRFIQSMPVSERGGLVDDKGPTQQAIDRVMAVAFKQAYGGDELVRLFAQATDPESRVVIGALARIAGRMAQLDGAWAFDIRGAVADAAGMAITAKRRGKKLADIVLQGDLDLSPEAVVVARFMADNIRSGQRIADGLLAWVDLALDQVRIVEQNASSTGMFGEEPTLSRQQLFERLGKNGNTATAIEEPAAQRGGAVAAGEGAERREAEPAGDGRGAEYGAGGRGAETEGSGQQVERAPSVGQDLLGDKPNTSQQQAADERARRASQDQQRRNAAPAPEEFALGMEDARTGREVDPNQQELLGGVEQAAPAAEPAADQGLDQPEALELASQTPAEWLADPAPERFSVGRSLTKAQRRQVLASLVDAYKAKGAQREFKGLDGNGNERYGYIYSPELFEKSDITGAMIRYYVTLPDGRIAHPSELFPDVSVSDIERMALEQDRKRIRLDAFDNAIKPYYSDFDSANLMAVQGQIVIEKNGRFAIIPERTGAIGQARQNGWELASPSGQVSEQSSGTRAGREQQDGLTSYTAEEAAQRQEEAAQAAKAEAARQRAADAQAARDEERKRIAQASVRAADTFELGQDPLDSLTGQGGMFDDAPDGKSGLPMFSFAGARAATADKHALVTAQDRLDAGEDPEAVRRETGWFKGNDGKWRFEISDADAVLMADTSGSEGRRSIGQMFRLFDYEDMGGLTVGRMLHHPALFAAYPEIANIRVEMAADVTGAGYRGGYSVANGRITINRDLSWREAMSTLLHEIQHGIQEVEGFATGSNPSRETDVSEFSEESRKHMQQLVHVDELAREHQVKPTSFVELAGYPDNVVATVKRWAEVGQWESNIAAIKRDLLTAREKYRRSAGEAEARNTQARQKMTDEERRATPPSSTADVADSDVIVTFNGKEMHNAPTPANATPARPSESPLVSAWTALAGQGDISRSPVSRASDLPQVFSEVAPGFVVEGQSPTSEMDAAWKIYPEGKPDAHGFVLAYKDGRVELNVPRLSEGDGGAQAYVATGNWALNTGRRFAADRYGLSSLGAARRLENLASMAVKFGTAEFMDMGGNKLGVQWTDNDQQNMENLLRAAYDRVRQAVPDIDKVAYDFEIQQFVPTAQDAGGIRQSDALIAALVDQARAAGLPVGRATIARAILTGTFIRGEGLPAALREAGNAAVAKNLSGVLYGRGAPFKSGATTSTIAAAIKKAYGNVLDRLQANGLVTLVQSQDEAIEAAAKARADKTGESLETVRERLMASVRNSISVWHGSPHRGIEKTGFTLNKIGTGEGAQAISLPPWFGEEIPAPIQSRPYTIFTQSSSQGDLNSAQAALEKADDFVRANRGNILRAVNSASDENQANSLAGNAKLLSDFVKSSAFKEHGFGGLDIPSQRMMLNAVSRVLQNRKVRESVIQLVPVDVMDMLGTQEMSPERLFNNMPMLLDLLAGDGDESIPTRVDGASRAIQLIARAAAERVLAPLDKGAPRELSSTLKADGGLHDGSPKGTENAILYDARRDYGVSLREALMTPEAAGIEAKFSKNGAIQGFYDPQSGQSFLIADGLTEAAAPGVLAHEVGIHMAADTTSDKGKAAFDKITARAGELLKLGRGNPFFDRVNQRMLDAQETSNEEAAAYIAEEYERDRVNAPASVKRWVTDFMAAVRAWLFGKGVLVKASDLGAADIAAIARANVRKAARGTIDPRADTTAWSPDRVELRFSRSGNTATQGSTYTLPEERFGGLRRKMQDYFIRALEVQNAVAQQGGAVDEQTDFYRAEERSSGRRAALVQDFGNNVVNPLMERAAELGVDLQELALYAYAKHAQERNEYIATINDRLPDGGSGMTTADADAILDKVRQEGREQDFEELHQGLMDITASTRALQLSEGLITQDEFDAMQAQYQNYIPLRGFEQVDEDGKTTGRSPGKGFNIRGQENLRALGRSSRAGELIENAIHDYIRTVDRGERNQVGKVFLNFVLKNPDAGLWEVDAERTRAAMDRQTGKVKGVTSIDKGEDTIAVKVAGREVYVRIHDPLLLRAMRKSHTDDRGDNERLVVRALGLYTALLRNTLTRYNPEFALTNALRDYGFGMAAMVDELGEKGAAKFTRHYAGAVAAAHRNERNKADPQNREWDKYFTEFRLAGGMTAGFYVKNTEEIGKDIRTMMLKAGAEPKNKTEALLASSPARAVAAAGRVLEYAGSVSENAARVAAYRTAREMGKSPSEAASIAKNLTTNFDRKGELGQVINAAYVFYNAAVQGSHRLLKMASNPKVAGYMAGFGSAGLALALANADWGGDDPDDGMAYWDKIPAYEKERNLIIMLPPSWRFEDAQRVGTDGHYVKIPLQYGLNLPVAYGYAIADVLRNHRDKSRGMSPVKAGVTMASYLAGAFNPFGGSVDLSNGSSMAQAALPSLGDAVVQFATGTNGFGRDVAPFKSPFDTKPDSENYNLRQADSVSLKIAQLLNRATGGSAAEAGGIDISAGTVENLIRNVSGGTGAFLYDVGNLAWKSVDRATGGDPDIFVREMPLYRRVYGELGGDVDQGIFYDSRKKTQEAAGIVKRSAEMDMEPSEENQTLARMDKFANKATRDLAKLRREMIRVKQDDSLSDDEKTKELRELRAERDRLTAGFNQGFTEVMREFFVEQQSVDKINK